jgi:hypothetical protein
MRLSTVIPLVSLPLNAVLLALVFLADSKPPPAAARLVAAGPRAGAATEAQLSWTTLAAETPVALRDRLRAEGFPPEITRAILTAQVREKYAGRHQALEAALAALPFWQQPDRKLRTEQRTLAEDELKELRDLVGPSPEAVESVRRELPFLSEEKIALLAGQQEHYRPIWLSFTEQPMTSADRDEFFALNQKATAENQAIETLEERLQDNMRRSVTASRLRETFGYFNGTEEEYRALFALQHPFDLKYDSLRGTNRNDLASRQADTRDLAENIAAALGPERYAEFRRAQDVSYRQTSQLVARLELPPETTNQAYALQQEFRERANAITRDASLSPADRTTQISQLGQEAQARLTPLFGGTRGFEAYRQYGGAWLGAFTPRPPPKK